MMNFSFYPWLTLTRVTLVTLVRAATDLNTNQARRITMPVPLGLYTNKSNEHWQAEFRLRLQRDEHTARKRGGYATRIRA